MTPETVSPHTHRLSFFWFDHLHIIVHGHKTHIHRWTSRTQSRICLGHIISPPEMCTVCIHVYSQKIKRALQIYFINLLFIDICKSIRFVSFFKLLTTFLKIVCSLGSVQNEYLIETVYKCQLSRLYILPVFHITVGWFCHSSRLFLLKFNRYCAVIATMLKCYFNYYNWDFCIVSQ